MDVRVWVVDGSGWKWMKVDASGCTWIDLVRIGGTFDCVLLIVEIRFADDL